MISLPTTADPNDYLFFTLVYLKGGRAVLASGKDLD